MRIVTFLALIATRVPAQTLPPQFFDLQSESQNASLTMMCEGQKPYRTMTCQFLSITMDKPSATEYRAALEKLRQNLSNDSDQKLLEQKDLRCKGLGKTETALSQHLAGMTPERASYARAGITQMKQLCACHDRSCIVDALLREKDSARNECRAHGFTYSLKFQKVGARRWVSNNGPEGICAVVSVETLEHEEKYDNVWTYTESSVVGNTEPELCKTLASQWQKPETFSWRTGSGLSTQCTSVVLSGSRIGPK